jgi:hypothetical protein
MLAVAHFFISMCYLIFNLYFAQYKFLRLTKDTVLSV